MAKMVTDVSQLYGLVHGPFAYYFSCSLVRYSVLVVSWFALSLAGCCGLSSALHLANYGDSALSIVD
jgi:hypothetical protein